MDDVRLAIISIRAAQVVMSSRVIVKRDMTKECRRCATRKTLAIQSDNRVQVNPSVQPDTRSPDAGWARLQA
jgi:hypothetical protein